MAVVKIVAGRQIGQRGLGSYPVALLGDDTKIYTGIATIGQGLNRVKLVDAATLLASMAVTATAVISQFATSLPTEGFDGQEVLSGETIIPLPIYISVANLYDSNDVASVAIGYKYHPLFGPTYGFSTPLVAPTAATTATGGIVLTNAETLAAQAAERLRLEQEALAASQTNRSAFDLTTVTTWFKDYWIEILAVLAVIEVIRYSMSSPAEKKNFNILGVL
jgi:hypothetical protein